MEQLRTNPNKMQPTWCSTREEGRGEIKVAKHGFSLFHKWNSPDGGKGDPGRAPAYVATLSAREQGGVTYITLTQETK